ncbi:MAG TPA: helix-turn-helix domain-containing protein [Candidatus Hydrogenedens sp.]|nr:helix-turn-helix domain-containing protein [Candidatus Hydrogenedens sp.]HPP57913.1 helix-turn-helix domain-containing protein [Candidatus Hydrogenedens sp.]
MPKEKVLTVEDIAEFLKLKPLTIRQMFRTGKLRGFKIGKSWRTTETFLIEDLNKMAKKFGVYIPKESKSKSISKKDIHKTIEEEDEIYPNKKTSRRKNKYDMNIGSLFDIDDEDE